MHTYTLVTDIATKERQRWLMRLNILKRKDFSCHSDLKYVPASQRSHNGLLPRQRSESDRKQGQRKRESRVHLRDERILEMLCVVDSGNDPAVGLA